MILDAETLEPAAAGAVLLAARSRPRAARDAEDRAARVGRRAEHRHLRRRDEAVAALRALRDGGGRGGGRARARARRGGRAPDRAARVAAGRPGASATSRCSTPPRPRGAAPGRERRSTSTSASRRPRPASSGSRRCCRGCRSCSRSPRTRPSWAGADTGTLSLRAGVLARAAARGRAARLRRRTPTGRRGSSGSRARRRRGRARRLWWDVRPHPRLGTLEVRIADQPTSLARDRAARRGCCAASSSERRRGPTPASRGDYRQNRWAAARFGLDARAGPPGRGRLAGARSSREELLGAARRRSRRRCASSRSRAGTACESVARGPRRADARLTAMATQTETIQVSGIRCERCVMRLARRARGPRGPRGREREPDGPGHARLGRRADEPRGASLERAREGGLPRARSGLTRAE